MPVADQAPALVRLIDYIGKKGPALAKKSPVALGAGLGLTFGMRGSMQPADVMEAAMMRERTGAPGAKFAELDVFETRKENIKVAHVFNSVFKHQEKTAAEFSIPGQFGESTVRGVGGQLGKGGMEALMQALSIAGNRVYDKMSRDPKRRQLFERIVSSDPVISQFAKSSPEHREKLQVAFDSMARFAPTLSTDPNAVTSLLRQVSVSAGPVDYNLLRGLAEAETAIQKARNPR
jgi:hypothetical protein